MGRMKWWGWGDEDVAFTHEDKPELGPFLERRIDIQLDGSPRARCGFDQLDVPEPTLPADLRAALEEAVGPEHVSTDALDRVVHARGKSLRDLVRHRRGDLGRLPDVVVRPGGEEEVAAVMRAALDADAVVIPFGGGTNISGSLEAPADEDAHGHLGRRRRGWTACSTIDAPSRLARVQAGVFGPELEAQLNARGWTSATSRTASPTRRSAAGSRRAPRACSPTSTATSPTSRARCGWSRPPARSSPAPSRAPRPGPSVREMVLGSEGRLGIITEATVHVHRVPEQRVILGYLFPDWRRALAAMRDIAESEAAPSVTRVSDAPETASRSPRARRRPRWTASSRRA